MEEDVLKNISFCDWRVLTSLSAVAIVALYYYLMSKYNYWKERGFPEIERKPLPLFGHTFKLLTSQRNMIDTFDDLYKASGDKPFAGYYQGTKPFLLVKDVQMIKQILIKDFHVFMDRGFEVDEEMDPLNGKALFNLRGQRWKKMRARLSPTFTSGRMKAMFPLMKECCKELIQYLKVETEKNSGEAIIEFKECMSCFTTDVIATCAFGIRCDALQNPETSEFRKMGKRQFEPTWKRCLTFMIVLTMPRLSKFLGVKLTDEQSSVFFRKFVKDMLKQREEAIDKNEDGAKGFGDFIHHLVLLKKRGLHPRDTKEGIENEDSERNIYKPNESDKSKDEPSWSNVEDDDLTAQVLLFFSAGFETSSMLLSFALFELSSSEHGIALQKKLWEEVDKVMKEDDGRITYEGLKKMHLLDRVLNEALRIYPPAGLLNRKVLQPYTIPGTNLLIEKGKEIFIPTQAMQRDERYFPNPMKFDPDRFLPEQKQKWNQYAFLPFGDGPRVCIGQRFAEMQSRLGLAALISKFEFEVCLEKTSVPLRFKKRSFIMTTETGIWLRVKPRTDKQTKP